MSSVDTTLITLTGGDRDWRGAPEEGSGVFTVGDHYVVRVVNLRVAVLPESGVGFNQPVLSMQYEVMPIHGVTWTTAQRQGQLGAWLLNGRDDLGTEYEVQSGASGFKLPDFTIYDSDLHFEPVVPRKAAWIEIRFMDSRSPERPVHTIRAELAPLD